ncbi:MAG: hypothetical protein HFF52_07265 [Lawsonibacter sp.]|nr:hypothetical protein [Lawsonibacter sp.]
MEKWKRFLGVALALCLLGTLTACSRGLTEKDAETYIKGYLDSAYLGSYDQAYVDLVEDMTMDDAKENHEYYIEVEAQNLLDYFEVTYPTDEMTERAEQLIETVYSKAQYKVGSASKTKDGDFVVEVTVSPIEFLNLISDEFVFDALDQSGYWETEDEEESDAIYGTLVLDKVEELLPQITYGKDQIIMIQLKLGEDGYYSLVETGMHTLDEAIIDYFGDFAE